MAKTEVEKLGEKIENRFKSLMRLFSVIKNEITLTLQAGGSVYVVPADPAKPEELKEAKIYTVDEAGVPTTEAPADGELTLSDGRVLVVSGGTVTEVRDVVDVEKLNGEIEALKAQLAEKETTLAAKETEITALKETQTQMKTAVDTIKNEFIEFKKQVPGDKKDKRDKDDEDAPKVDTTKMSRAELFRHNRLEQIKMEKTAKV